MSTKIKAEALAKAALQATARALHTAQLAHDAYRKAEDAGDAGGDAGGDEAAEGAALMGVLRDRMLDVYAGIPDDARKRLLSTRATITSDELIDLLAMCVKG